MRRRFRKKPAKMLKPRYRINEAIRSPFVFLIDEAGTQVGELEIGEAIAMAKGKGFDLVEVSPNAQPPVCKIIDYGKFQYQQSKLDRAKKANAKKVEVKGIRIGFRTDKHDLEFKRSQAEKFLKKGNKVKIEILLRGREKAHQNLAREALKKFVDQISIPHRVEEEIKRFPGGFNVVILPQ